MSEITFVIIKVFSFFLHLYPALEVKENDKVTGKQSFMFQSLERHFFKCFNFENIHVYIGVFQRMEWSGGGAYL